MFVDQQSQLKNTINTQYHKRMKLQHIILKMVSKAHT